MSTGIRNSLASLDQAIDRLDQALLKNETKQQQQEQELYAARAALNDNGASTGIASGINGENAEQFALRLDNAIDKVERVLREG